MTIRILAQYGVGEWAYGAVIEVDERRAQRLILTGYAEAVKPPSRKDKESVDARTKPHSRV